MSARIVPPRIDFLVVLPEVICATAGVAVLLVRAFMARRWARPSKAVAVCLGIAAASTAAVVAVWAAATRISGVEEVFGGSVAADTYGLVAKALLGATAALALLVGESGLRRDGAAREEFSALVLLAATGMMAMVGAQDLVIVFLGLELFSVSFYVLAGFIRDAPASQESALKYFLLGAFASAFFLYGVALNYGAVGSTNLSVLADVASRGGFSWLMLGGLTLLTVGLAFKVGAVPFHMWVPDVYQGAPSYIAGFLAAGAKIAGFGAALRIFSAVVPARTHWLPIVVTLGVLTMAVGAAGAIAQKNVKRMLAYSSVVHAGYLFLAVAAPSGLGIRAALFYLATYAAMVIGVFAVVAIVQRRRTDTGTLDDFRGLARQRPVLGATLAVLLLGLAGVPPTSGFFGKLFVFQAAVEQGLVGFALVGALASVVAAFFYIRLLLVIYEAREELVEGDIDTAAAVPVGLRAGLALAVLATLVLGVAPELLFALVSRAALPLPG